MELPESQHSKWSAEMLTGFHGWLKHFNKFHEKYRSVLKADMSF